MTYVNPEFSSILLYRTAPVIKPPPASASMNFALDQPFAINSNLFANTNSSVAALPQSQWTGPTPNRNPTNQFQPNYNLQMSRNNANSMNTMNTMNLLMTNSTSATNVRSDAAKQVQLSAQEINDFLS